MTNQQNTQAVSSLSLERLKESLHYNPSTGLFVWKISPCNSIKIGDIAGYKRKDDYIVLRLDKKRYLAHRVAWFYVYGVFPDNCLDHINQNPSDNRIDNLREVTFLENCRNKRKGRRNSTGCLGVSYSKKNKKYQSSIRFNQKHIWLGYSDNLQDAIDKRKQAEIKYGYHENHGKGLRDTAKLTN